MSDKGTKDEIVEIYAEPSTPESGEPVRLPTICSEEKFDRMIADQKRLWTVMGYCQGLAASYCRSAEEKGVAKEILRIIG